MTYDKSLDERLFSEELVFDYTKLIVSVFSYAGAKPKLQVIRQVSDQDTGEWKFAKMGRLRKEEVDALIGAMTRALKVMK